MSTPVFIMLCGLPGTGKSTWVEREATVLETEKHRTFIVSSDDLVETVGKAYNLRYNELFGDITYVALERLMYKVATKLFERRVNVIWDQTNLTVKSRKRKLDMVPQGYYKVAVIFNLPKDHMERLNKRGEAQGKVIPAHVIDSMAARFVRPTKEEGFDDVIEVTM